MPNPTVRAGVTALLLVPAAAACFSYRQPIGQSAVPEGSVVRATLKPEGVDSLALEVGPRVARITGHLVADSGGVLAIRGETVTRLDGADDLAASTVVHVPRRLVSRLEIRRFDGLRTGLLVGGIAAVTLGVRSAAGSASGGANGGSSGGK